MICGPKGEVIKISPFGPVGTCRKQPDPSGIQFRNHQIVETMNKILWNALWRILSDNALLFNSRTVGELHSVGRRINASKPWLDEEGWEWDLLSTVHQEEMRF